MSWKRWARTTSSLSLPVGWIGGRVGCSGKHKGGKFGDLAKSEKLNRSYFSQLLRRAYLAPDNTPAILDGRQPAGLTTTTLIERADLPISWREQRRTVGFA